MTDTTRLVRTQGVTAPAGFRAAGIAAGINFLYVVVGLALVGASFALFMKCKPWEHQE